jgi:transposase-like protein
MCQANQTMESLMAGFTCKHCGSDRVRKNGTTANGRQQYYCHACGVYTTTDARAKEWAAKLDLVERLHHEGLSQRAIARVTGVSRPTIIAYLKKKIPAHR